MKALLEERPLWKKDPYEARPLALSLLLVMLLIECLIEHKEFDPKKNSLSFDKKKRLFTRKKIPINVVKINQKIKDPCKKD